MLIKREFIKNKDVAGDDAIEGKLIESCSGGGSPWSFNLSLPLSSFLNAALRGNAVRGLANYLLIENSLKDEKFQQSQKEFVSKEARTLKDHEL